MNKGKDSLYYNNIYNHFNTMSPPLKGFGVDTMTQIVGENSVMHMLNTTFSYNVGHLLYQQLAPDRETLIIDQWSSRKLTKNKGIIMVPVDKDEDLVDSIYDCYNNNIDLQIPDSYTIPGHFHPELNYYLEKMKGIDPKLVNLTTTQASILMDKNISNSQSLINPESMYFFYE